MHVRISIHAPTRGATIPRKTSPDNRMISIHAPTRGATADFLTANKIYYISIHAPTRGATAYTRFKSSESRNFNPRSHKGSDIFAQRVPPPLVISIHAPTRGATICRNYRNRWHCKFQSTLPQGERPSAISIQKAYTKFQSTLPQGERHWR